MESVTQVQILGEVDCVSLVLMPFKKSLMHLPHPGYGYIIEQNRIFKLGLVNSQREAVEIEWYKNDDNN